MKTMPSINLMDVYLYIQRREQIDKDIPSVMEIAARFPSKGKPRTNSVVFYWLNRMVELKMIEKRGKRRARNIRTLPLDLNDERIKAMMP